MSIAPTADRDSFRQDMERTGDILNSAHLLSCLASGDLISLRVDENSTRMFYIMHRLEIPGDPDYPNLWCLECLDEDGNLVEVPIWGDLLEYYPKGYSIKLVARTHQRGTVPQLIHKIRNIPHIDLYQSVPIWHDLTKLNDDPELRKNTFAWNRKYRRMERGGMQQVMLTFLYRQKIEKDNRDEP